MAFRKKVHNLNAEELEEEVRAGRDNENAEGFILLLKFLIVLMIGLALSSPDTLNQDIPLWLEIILTPFVWIINAIVWLFITLLSLGVSWRKKHLKIIQSDMLTRVRVT
jgi:hypothetical protein